MLMQTSTAVLVGAGLLVIQITLVGASIVRAIERLTVIEERRADIALRRLNEEQSYGRH